MQETCIGLAAVAQDLQDAFTYRRDSCRPARVYYTVWLGTHWLYI